MRFGVLALQGGFALHERRLVELGHSCIPINRPHQLDEIDGLVIPGGESSVLLKLCNAEFRSSIIEKAKTGMPILATCAGLILISHKVTHPEQESLDLLEVEVERNAFGRQRDSFITSALQWTKKGKELIGNLPEAENPIEGVFIRAPRIRDVGASVDILVELEQADSKEPVMVRQGNIFGATFHPELSPGAKTIHSLFARFAGESRS